MLLDTNLINKMTDEKPFNYTSKQEQPFVILKANSLTHKNMN